MIQKMRWWIIVLVGLTVNVSAQELSRYNWYFGNSNTAIRFSRSDNTASLITNQKLPFGTGGSAVASNPVNADLIFYTDGSRVYDITNNPAAMPNGTGLLASTSGNQPVAICPVPGAPNQYYIFANSANGVTGGNVTVSIVDMTLPGNSGFGAPFTGDVTTKNQPVAGLTNRSEAMIVMPHDNGTDYWLITHENGTDNYTVTHVQPAGVFANTNFNNLTGNLAISATNFAYHEGTAKIAVSPLSVNRNISILDFDDATGTLSFDQFVLNSASTLAGAIYDTEWSPSGRFLYISRRNDSGADAQVLQFDTTNPLNTLTPVLAVPVNSSYGLQLAPDTAIYHIYQATGGGPFLIGKLTDTDSVGTLVQYESTAFTSNPNINGTQFPSFAPASDPNLNVTFVSAGSCSSSPVSFFPTVTPHADSLVWDFGDGQGSNAWSPVHTYENGGTFSVSVTAFLNGESATATNPIDITQFDLQLQLVQDTTACRCELPARRLPGDTCTDFSVQVEIQGGSPTSIVWSNGQTGTTLRPDSAGYYYVVATLGTCSAYAGVNIREYGLEDQRANIWYFGQNAGIDFNEQPAISIPGPVNSPEGVSVISDRNGQVILSTDGVHVYDKNDVEITQTADGTPIVIPPGIGGESGSTQSALIIPVPGDETLYYIFTTQEVHGAGMYELRYTLFDLKENSGDGGIIEFNQLLFSRSTERITGNAGWLIAHEYGNNSFRAYQITPAGISSPVISSVGSDHSFNAAENGQGYMKLGAQNVLAVALSEPGISNVLEIFDFDNTIGIVSNFRVANLNSANGQVYGVEFLGNKIFATLRGTPSAIREFYIDFEGNPQLINPPLADISEELGAIQVGPDGQIYVAVNNRNALGTITFNPDTLQVSNFNVNGFALTSGQSRLGLPNFIQNVGNPIQPPGMDIAGFCEGEPTFFTGFGTDPIDQFFWSFGDGTSSDSAQVQHTYPQTGIPTTYTVTLHIFNRCGLDTTFVQDITIFPPPPNPTFLPSGVLQPVICNGDLLLEALPASTPNLADLTFLWSTGETDREINVSRTSNIGVTITNTVNGCTSAGSIIVADNRPPVDLGPDQTLCQNVPVLPLDASNPGAVYDWSLIVNNGLPVSVGTAQTQPVDSSLPGIFEYIVSVTDPITTCTVQDTVTFTFNESPAFTAVPSNTAACGTNTGQIALTITNPVGSLFSYFVTGPSTTLQGNDQPIGPVVNAGLTALGAGTYGITVADQVSGCATITTVGISDNVIDIISAVAQTPTCDPVAVDVQTTGIVTIGSATYRITDSGTGIVVVPSTSLGGTANFTTLPVAAPGTYTIEVSADGCIATEDITINPDLPVPFTFTSNGCTDPVTITVTGGDTYSWTGPDITSATNIASITATPPQGPQTYTVTVTQAGFCPVTQDIVVEVNNNLTVDFTQSDACAAQVTLTATTSAPGSYTYLWTRNGTPMVGGQTILANASDNGATYSVTVQNTASGCSFNSPARQVIVANLQLAMTTTTPCTGSPFTLTATTNQPGTNFQWSVDGSNISGATSATLQRSTGGLYRVTGTLPGCTRFVENQIALLPTTPGALPQRALICNNPANPNPDTREILLDPGANFISYAWSQGGVPLGVTTQTLLVIEPGVYGVDLTNSFGCVSTDIIDVIEQCQPRIVAPTAFRPGSPIDTNREFGVLTFFIEDTGFQVFIFNRWGEMVYQSDNREFKWNGGYNNNPSQLLPAGTYSYVVKYRSIYDVDVQEKRGGVVLMR